MVDLKLRKRGTRREYDTFEIQGLDARRDGDQTILTHIVGISLNDNDERKRRYAVADILTLAPNGEGRDLLSPDTIMLWLREQGGIATDADRDAAAWARAEEQVHPERTQYDSDDVISSGLRLRIWLDYVDGQGETSRREITIVSMHGEGGEDPSVWRIEAYCHQRRDHRTFLLYRIGAVADSAEDLTPMAPEEIDRWLRRKIGRETAHDAAREQDDRATAGEAQVRGERTGERARRDTIASGQEYAVVPQLAQVLSRRADGAEHEQGAEGYVIGFDTDPEGRATVVFFAAKQTAKRGRALYLGATRTGENHRLLMLRSPPESEPIEDVAAWVSALPRDAARTIARHG